MTLPCAPAAAPPQVSDHDGALESLLGVIMAWIGGEDEARPGPMPPGSLAEALAAALVALWEDRIAQLQPGGRSGVGIERLPVGAGLLDPSGRLLRANPCLLQLLDQHSAKAVGAPITELLQLSPARWAAWTAEAETLGQHRVGHLISRTTGPLRLDLHLAPAPTGWAIAAAEAEPAPAPPPPPEPAGAAPHAAVLDAALEAGLPHALLRVLLADALSLGPPAPPFAGRALRLHDRGAGPAALEELRWRLRLRGAAPVDPASPRWASADPQVTDVWALAPRGEPPAGAPPPPSAAAIHRQGALGPPPPPDEPRGPMSTPPLPAFDAPALQALGQALSAQGAPAVEVQHLPVLDREATAYLTEVEQATGKTGLFQRLLDLFINDLARHEAAVQASVAGRDWVALGRAAHGIKGSAATIGARRIEQVARSLESTCRAEPVAADLAQALGAQLVEHCGEFRSAHR